VPLGRTVPILKTLEPIYSKSILEQDQSYIEVYLSPGRGSSEWMAVQI
jgi:hypothetical protein